MLFRSFSITTLPFINLLLTFSTIFSKLSKTTVIKKTITATIDKGIEIFLGIFLIEFNIMYCLFHISYSKAYLILDGSLDIETFFMFLFVGTRIFDPLDLALTNYTGLQMASVSGERILKLLEMKPMKGKDALNSQNDIRTHKCFVRL